MNPTTSGCTPSDLNITGPDVRNNRKTIFYVNYRHTSETPKIEMEKFAKNDTRALGMRDDAGNLSFGPPTRGPEGEADNLVCKNVRDRLKMRHVERLNGVIAFAEPGSLVLAEALEEREFIARNYFDQGNLDLVKVVPQESPRYGRHLLVNRDIARDGLVFRELPFVRLLIADHRLRCDYCLAYAPFVLLPCPSCTQVLYCSDTCTNRAQQEYHSLECAIMPILRSSQYTELELLAWRATVRAVKMFDEDLSMLKKFVRNFSKKIEVENYQTPFRRDYLPHAGFVKVYRLSTNRRRLDKAELVGQSRKALDLATLLMGQLNQTEGKLLVAEMMLHLLQIARVNALTLFRDEDDPATECAASGKHSEPYGMVLLSTGSLFNHSCRPNVSYSLAKDGTVKFTAIEDIPDQAQAFIDYRIENTWPRHRFICTCVECVDSDIFSE